MKTWKKPVVSTAKALVDVTRGMEVPLSLKKTRILVKEVM